MKLEAAIRIVLLGPPGAGKGTQACQLSTRLAIPHVSTGEMMRAAVQSGSALGQEIKAYLDRGELVPDETVVAAIRKRLGQDDCKRGFLLDGFPRNIDQARVLTAMLAELQIPITHVIELAVPEEVLLERITKRGASGSGRSDDNSTVAKKRLEVYRTQTIPVTDFYKAIGAVFEVDGVGTVDQVNDRIVGRLGLGSCNI